MSMFKKATRVSKKAKILLGAPSGAGKTLGALMIAKGIGGRIALADTERDSASLYSEEVKLKAGKVFTPPEFFSVNIEAPYTPEKFVDVIEQAEKEGFDTLIIDSLTHEWHGSGGCLEINDSVAKAKYRGNTWSAWSDVNPRHKALLDKILNSNINIICTVRQKTETVQDASTKKVMKMGMKNEQREGIEYEFDISLDLIHENHLVSASKDRTGLFLDYNKPLTEDVGVLVKQYFSSGKVFSSDDKIQKAQVDYINQVINETKSDKEKFLAHLATLGIEVSSIEDITEGDYPEVKNVLEKKRNTINAGGN